MDSIGRWRPRRLTQTIVSPDEPDWPSDGQTDPVDRRIDRRAEAWPSPADEGDDPAQLLLTDPMILNVEPRQAQAQPG